MSEQYIWVAYVVGALAILVPLIVAIVKPIARLTEAIVKLTVTFSNMNDRVERNEKKAHESHKALWDHNEEQDEKISDHEKRIFHLEHI